MIKCPKCGAELNYDVKSKMVKCEHCRSEFNPEELKVKIKKAEELASSNTYEGKSYLCSQCGATLLTFDETAITFCSYCGSQAMIESKMVSQNNPDFIIPFEKTKEECIAIYKRKLSRSLFTPKYMKSDIIVNKFRGIYIPYCVYKLTFHGVKSYDGERYKGRWGDYKYYNDYKISARVDAEYEGLSYDLISNFYDKFSHSIPHDFKKVQSFNPNYLSGFYADASDLDHYIYEDLAESIVSMDSINHMSKIRTFSKYGCKFPKVKLDVTERKVGMFPVYFLAIRDKNNKYVNYAIVNGQTGKIAVDMPIDFKKYIIISILLTIPMFLLINGFIVMTPQNICIFSIIASIICMVISIYQANKIYERENHLDDIGYIRKNLNSQVKYVPQTEIMKDETNIDVALESQSLKLPKRKTFNYIYKTLLAIIIGVIALLCNFVYDIYYYSAVFIMFGLIIWNFSDLIKYHNLLVSTKLPQLEKRGGDENE